METKKKHFPWAPSHDSKKRKPFQHRDVSFRAVSQNSHCGTRGPNLCRISTELRSVWIRLVTLHVGQRVVCHTVFNATPVSKDRPSFATSWSQHALAWTRAFLCKASASPHGTARQRIEGTPLKDWCAVPSTVHTTGRKVRELVRPMFLHGHKLDRTKLPFTILFCVVSCVPGDHKCPARPLGRKYLLLLGDV